jgi:integrating conjugative element protein (TIGR03765 family)
MRRALARTPANRIDAGLGQVNLGYHAHRYEHPCDLLDPYRNLAIAAEILQEQHTPGEDWLVAIGRYHRPAGGAPAARYRRSVHRHLTRVLGPGASLPNCPEPHAMNRILLAALRAAGRHRRRAGPRPASQEQSTAPLIVVEDKGGASALAVLPGLESAGCAAQASRHAATAPPIGGPADAEAAMLPVRSARLSPGDEPRRVIRAPGLTPLFLVGDDDRSRAWLEQRRAALQELRAVGLVVNVATPEALAALRRLAPGLMLSPASGDDLAQRLGIRTTRC